MLCSIFVIVGIFYFIVYLIRLNFQKFVKSSMRSPVVIDTDSDAEEILNVPDVKCMVTEWSEFDACSVTCGVGTKTRQVHTFVTPQL